ncbi:PQQ-dependent sugar dehydrogenase [Caenimonas aquaedulcis]|uniref:Sorbosone dehydrogenase family protein n=1 Tax=Caenimonas aquaedulcis TaxID=2793270 RepID=A0A931H4S3_9BURK|nr:PQQ-dependent sugar dehydrogenase [Caenimonas aquaedulcis]MBG9388482.1 sorbosone dehydrogenase family protein [Caenimonas aquaedulcis]
MRHILPACLWALALLRIATPAHAADPAVDKLKLPAGFTAEVWAKVDNARQMALGRVDGSGGTLFVGSSRAGKVEAVRFDAAFKAQRNYTIATGLQIPMGVAYRDGNLYVSAVSRIVRFDGIEKALDKPPAPVLVTDKLTTDTHHGGKFLAFGPDGKLYVPTGAPCNICEPGARYARLARMNPDGSGIEVFASGIRNTVGFDWDPATKQVWFTDNGRDMLGDDLPADELNHAPRAGMHFGYPYCHQGDVPDPEFGAKRPCGDFTPPAQKLGAHVASLGMRFYTGTMFPPEYRGSIFIAEHGSWNRSSKSGYRVTNVRLKDGKAVAYEPFLTGFLEGQSAWGRPSDVLVLPDGSLLVADDTAGAIYRITYKR